MMLRALTESRERQARLVTDAGHELRTPLTSLRTNVELLMASMAPGAPRIPEEEMAGLRADVIAQIEELSTLVGDLVDLTRDDAGVTIHEPVDLSEVVDRSLERVRRRRNDIEFDVARRSAGRSTATRPACRGRCSTCSTTPRSGARPAAGSACGWSRSTRTTPSWWCPTRARAFRRGARAGVRAVLPVDVGAGDAGSGLGLAIVKQVVVKHGGTLRIDDTVARRRPAGDVDPRAAAGPAPIGDGATRVATREGGAVDGIGRQRREWVIGEWLCREVWASPERSLSGFSAQGGTVGARLSLLTTDRLTHTTRRKSQQPQ